MTPEQLKASILQMAMQGKLVEQRTNEGTGTELYNKIVSERNKLIKAKIIKNVKIDEDVLLETVPFDIPESWKWVKIGMLEEINLGFTYRPEYTEDGVYFLSVKDISGGAIDFSNAKKVSQETYDNAAYGSKPRKGDILFGRVGTIGKPQIIEVDEPFCIFVSLGFFRDHTNIMDKQYVSYWMDTKLFEAQVSENVKGAAQKNLNTNWLKDFLIPLPPLEEQHRIVAKIEELLPFVDRYAEAYEKLERFNAKFPEDMKKSILQYAIQGKLVEQRPEEGTAEELYQQIQKEKQKLIKDGKIKKEKPLAEISENEIPFDIPDTWKWVRLRNVCKKIVDGDHNPPAGHSLPTDYLMLSATNINHDKIVELDKVRFVTKEVFEIENQRTNVECDDIFFTIVGSMGRSCVYKGGMNICFQRSVSVLTTFIYPEYLKYVLDTAYIQNFMSINSTGTAQKGFYLKQVENLVVPLPPLEEQHRIVAKIDGLLPYCNHLAR